MCVPNMFEALGGRFDHPLALYDIAHNPLVLVDELGANCQEVRILRGVHRARTPFSLSLTLVHYFAFAWHSACRENCVSIALHLCASHLSCILRLTILHWAGPSSVSSVCKANSPKSKNPCRRTVAVVNECNVCFILTEHRRKVAHRY